MTPLSIVLAIAAIGAGALFPLQAAVNAELARYVGGPLAATAISISVSMITLIVINTAVLRQLPSLADIQRTPLHVLVLGGMIGVTFLAANTYLAPRLGAAAMLCFVIAGQVVAAIMIDRLGLFGFVVRELTVGRVVGVLLVFAGAAMVRLT